LEYVTDAVTVHGPTSYVEAKIIILDGPNAGQVNDAARLFGSVLVNSTKGFVGSGKPVLGRFAQGTAQKGKNAPWILEKHNGTTDPQLAMNWINGQAQSAFPTATAPAPAQQWPGDAPAAAPTQAAATPVPTGLSVQQVESIKGILEMNPSIEDETVASAVGVN